MIIDDNYTETKKINYNNILDLFTTISSRLETTGFISILEYRSYNLYKKLINYDAINEFENKLVLEQIKKSDEKIEAFKRNKKEYEYLSDYFVTSLKKNFDFELENPENNEENEQTYQTNFTEEINEIEESKIDLNSHNLSKILAITSNEFLNKNLNLESNEIETLKGKYSQKENVISKKEENIIPVINSYQKNYLDILPSTTKRKNLRGSSINTINSKNSNNQNELQKQIDRELEEEVNEEIFSYAKNMKHYASSFNDILVKDNSKLGKIEAVQDSSKSKTDKSLKSLKEFNYSLTIGFFKLLLMFIIVIGTFVMTLLTIRIFPKLVN